MSITQGADTYIELADADTYIATLSSYATAWAALSDADKETHLKRAAIMLDDKFQGRFVGELYSRTQAMGFPRVGYDNDGRLITGSYPTRLKYAQAEIAARLANGETLYSDVERGGAVKREKVGPLETEYFTGAPSYKVIQIVNQLMKRYLLPAGNIVLR